MGIISMRAIFFKVRSVANQTTVKIKNVLFFNIQLYLPAPSLHSCHSKVDIFYSLVPAFQLPFQGKQSLVFSASLLCLSVAHFLCQNAVLLSTISCEERVKIRGSKVWVVWWVIKHFPLKMLQEPLCHSCSLCPSIVMKKDNA